MIGVAVSTYQRPEMLAHALRAWDTFLPPRAVLVVVDDGSDPPAIGATHRNVHNLGIAATKNIGIRLLMDAGCDHLFLCDDDAWPRLRGWAVPYLTDDEPHLCLSWGRALRLTIDRQHTTWRRARGVAMYVRRHVIDRVGGLREEFTCGGEHLEWSRRIHNAGLTSAPFIDLRRSAVLWHAEDRGKPGETARDVMARRHATSTWSQTRYDGDLHDRLLARYHDSDDFVPYRTRDLGLTPKC